MGSQGELSGPGQQRYAVQRERAKQGHELANYLSTSLRGPGAAIPITKKCNNDCENCPQTKITPTSNLAPDIEDSAIVCRCEKITLGQIRKAVKENDHDRVLDRVKQATRQGMGYCGGYQCTALVSRLLTMEKSHVGPTNQSPVKDVRNSSAVVEGRRQRPMNLEVLNLSTQGVRG